MSSETWSEYLRNEEKKIDEEMEKCGCPLCKAEIKKKEKTIDRTPRCDCDCGFSKMTQVVRPGDPAYVGGLTWHRCACSLCGPSVSGRQQCIITIRCRADGGFCDDCFEHQDKVN